MTNPIPMPLMADRQNGNPLNFRPSIAGLSPNPGGEMLRYGWQKPGILSLGQGESSAKTPDFIAEAAFRAMQEGKTFYGPGLGLPELRQELSDYYARIYGLDIPSARIFVTASGTTAVHLSLTAILDKGDEVVAVTPIWKNLLGAVELAQSTAVQVPLENRGKGWSLDLDKLFDACTPRTKVILLVSPSNPTGWVMSAQEIRAVLDFARARGIWIIADEVYGRIVFDGSKHAPSFLEHADPDDRLLVVNSFSKNWAMTGWRLGWLVGPAAAESTIRDIALYDNLCPPTVTQYGGIAALRHGEPFLQEQVTLWKSNRDLVMDRFAQNRHLYMSRPESTFYGFFRVEGENDCIRLGTRLIDEGLLSLAPGCAFGKCCTGWMRMCFAGSEQKVLDALDRLEKVIPA